MNEIIVYDSGIGGIPILCKLQKAFPGETFLYFSDPLRMPYGAKTEKELIAIVQENFAYFSTYRPKAVIVACNTVSEVALPHLKGLRYPVLGVEQQVERTIAKTGCLRPCVLCTERTAEKIASHLTDEIRKKVRIVAAKKLASEIENRGGNLSVEEVQVQTSSLGLEGHDLLFLGCTHYIWIAQQLKLLYPHLLLSDGTDFLLDRATRMLFLKETDTVKKESEATKEHDFFQNAARGSLPLSTETPKEIQTGTVHFMGDGSLKNQNTYLFFYKHLFKNQKNK